MLKQFMPKEDKENVVEVLFIIAATLIISTMFIVFRIFPRLETVLNRFLKRARSKPRRIKNGRPIKKRYTILGKTLRR